MLDILNLLDELKHYSKMVTPGEYIKLDDSILQELARANPEDSPLPGRVREAQAMLDDLTHNRTYKLVTDIPMSAGTKLSDAAEKYAVRDRLERDLPSMVKSRQGPAMRDLRQGDIRVRVSEISKGWGEKNPMEMVRFYSWEEDSEGRQFMSSSVWPEADFTARHEPTHSVTGVNHQVRSPVAALPAWPLFVGFCVVFVCLCGVLMTARTAL